MPMHRPLLALACALALLCGLAPAARAAPPPAAALEREITRLEQDWNAAYGANDLPKYFAQYADDAVLIFDDGRSSLAAYRKSWTESVQGGSPLESVRLSDLVVRVAPGGETVVASYRLDVRSRHPDGKVSDEHAFETDVWQPRGGAWKVVHVHYSVAK
ncbi:MAG TPA: nuclear transport factor 2 family protein [Steroidobacteraceae bacterium]|nr:nuclear transport factor 2 family protein [Steroidobacteraceae bacterium]